MGRTRAGTETRVRPWARSARAGVSAPPASAAPSADAARATSASNAPGHDVRASSAESVPAEPSGRYRDSGAATRDTGSTRSAPGWAPDYLPTPAVDLAATTDEQTPVRPNGLAAGTHSAAELRDRTVSGEISDATDDSETSPSRRRGLRGGRSRRRDDGRARSDSATGTSNRRSRTGSARRDAEAEKGIGEQADRIGRVPDALREAGELALHTVRKWADPRERELRRRRRVRRRSLRWSAASGMTVLGTAGLVAISAPVWAVVVVGGGTVALVTGAAVSTRRYLELRRNPLPPAAFVPRRLPAVRSAARAPIARLIRAERAMYELGRHIAEGGRVPADDLADTLATAGSGAAALHALAGDVAAMEQAVGVVADSGCGPQLSRQRDAMVERLESGVGEYEQLVSAAGRILAAPPATGAPADEFGWAMLTLREAADRLDGWAQALTDLADRH
ncbi:hypothetical protein AB0L57_12070 [Nocardia sp. NPDC052254]|uniref:phage shock envelope stress response protein PspM n=1 Tax=Nocardia sp. NPDC052254 TaxID=3155681 RepID=UPI0034429343